MLTDKDIDKLKSVFATKEDLDRFEKRMDGKFVGKNEFSTTIDNLTREVIDFVDSAVTGAKEEIITEIKSDINGLRIELRGILSNHERRLRKLEEKDLTN